MKGNLLLTFAMMLLFASNPVLAAEDHVGHGDPNAIKRAGMVKNPKPQLLSKKKRFHLTIPQLPKEAGMAVIPLTITDGAGNALSDNAEIQVSFYMPGMEMDLPPADLKRIDGLRYQLTLHTNMPGYWKAKLEIKDGSLRDRATIKIIFK